MSDKKMYCGPGPVPKGKVRASLDYCIKHHQIRYYGIVAIDPDVLQSYKEKPTDLVSEQLKLKKIEDKAKILIKNIKHTKLVLEDDDATPSKIKLAQKQMDSLLKKRDKMVKQLKSQKQIIESIVENNKIDSDNEKQTNKNNDNDSQHEDNDSQHEDNDSQHEDNDSRYEKDTKRKKLIILSESKKKSLPKKKSSGSKSRKKS